MADKIDDGGAGSLLDEIEGEVRDGKFVVSHWPKPRWSNPNFLEDMLADFEKASADAMIRARATHKG